MVEDGFEDIATAHLVPAGTVADLKMPNGRVYRCAWAERGRITAWWPLNSRRKSPIALYEPTHWRKVSGVQATPTGPSVW